MEQYYLELCNDPIRFDPFSQINEVFFDYSNKQLFTVRSGGATGIAVKGLTENDTLTFCMEDKGAMSSIKFSPDHKLLAIQRTDKCVEFIKFANNQPCNNAADIIVHQCKSATTIVHGFVWIHNKEVALISNTGVEIFTVNIDKKQLKSIKSLSLTTDWFSWSPTGNLAVLSSNKGMLLTPILIKQGGVITRLPKIEWKGEHGVPDRDLTLAEIYGTLAILILKPTSTRLVEVIIYLLNGPGLAPQKSHILQLGHSGRFAMNIVDDLIVVHHQASATSLLFDIKLTNGTVLKNDIVYHTPVTLGRPIKPFPLQVPSLSLDGKTKNCELYSPNWVLFQPNIVIDAKLGCLWYVKLRLDSLCNLITDRVKLVELLLNRTNAKSALLATVKELLTTQYNGNLLPVIENVFDKLNAVYSSWVTNELNNITAQPSSAKQVAKTIVAPRVLIDQNDLFVNIFSNLSDATYIGNVLMLYITSLARHNIAAQHDISKLVIVDLVRRRQFDTLQNLIKFSLINESKVLACFLLSLSHEHLSVTQMALDMLYKLNAETIINEVLLGQGKIIEALRLANKLAGADTLSARKYLEAAKKTNNPIIFYTVYTWFQQRNIRQRGSPDFLKTELCEEYINHYQKLYCS